MCFRYKIKQLMLRCSSNTSAAHYRGVFLLGVVLQMLLLQQQTPHVFTASVTKGLNRMRTAKIASVHGLQAAAESISSATNQWQPVAADNSYKAKKFTPLTTTTTATATATATATKKVTTAASAAAATAGRYEIRSVSGEPNYKSVNLTWEVEFVPAADFAASAESSGAADAVTNSSAEVEPPKAFQIFFCELQSFGPHRCRSKLVNESQRVEPTAASSTAPEGTHANDATEAAAELTHNKHLRHYETLVENLRMATKYSFHIRAQTKRRHMKVTGRKSELFDNKIEDGEGVGAGYSGETIIIPTKGFTAEATRCLPHASEIEVETGPYFGGKIVVDGGNCGIKGNADDPKDRYTMRIDHKMCGSLVKPETNTVETFITVQENLGIYTHSTRRFVVVCSFQSGMQTVRASFTVPGKGGVAAAVENDPFEPDERMGREQRYMRFVDKSELVLKEVDDEDEHPLPSSDEESLALVKEVKNPKVQENNKNADALEAVAVLEDIIPGVNEAHIKHENEVVEHNDLAVPVAHARSAKYAKLVVDRAEHETAAVKEWYEQLDEAEEGRAYASTLHYVTLNLGSVALTICISVIIIGIFVVVVYRELRRQKVQRHSNGNSNNNSNSKCKKLSLQPKESHKRLQQKPVPRSLQTTQRGSM